MGEIYGQNIVLMGEGRGTPKNTLFAQFTLSDMLTLNGNPKIGNMIPYHTPK